MDKKNTKNKIKPAFVVDLTKAETSADVMLAFANARFEAKVPLEQRDIDIITMDAMVYTLEAIDDILASLVALNSVALCKICCKKKLPWYKRFWNWLTGKNK